MSRQVRPGTTRTTALATAAATTAGALVAVALTAAPGTASRAVSESYTVPSNGVLRLTGHGFGHGHGMSQYGAQGAALAGLTHRQILSFYYPGTTLGTTSGTIRVLISADTDGDVRVVPASGLAVREVSSGASYALPTTAGIVTWRLRTVAGKTVVDYDDGAWHTWAPAGHTITGDAEFYRPGPLTLRVSGTTRSYRGALRLSAGHTVDVLSMDDYVKGVVPREMPASWDADAVRAQAVAARTYGAFDRDAHPTRSYQTCDTTSCQVYGGVSAEDPRSNAAVDATANQVLTYGGKPAFTQFSSSDGGWTTDGGMPYLVAKADPYDGFSGNPVHTWSTTLTRASIEKQWPSLGTLERVTVTQRDGNGEWYGRVESLTLDGSSRDVVVGGSTFRSTFGLRSAWFHFGTGTTSTPTPTPTPPPTTAPTPAPAKVSPITLRWRAIGGRTSVVGSATSREYSVGHGRTRIFQHGRIYYLYGNGAHELFGPVVRAYVRRGAATSHLGFPRTRPMRAARGQYARFQHGVLFVFHSGRVKVTYYHR